MTDDIPRPPPVVATPQRSLTLKRVFFDAQGLRNGWKAALFVFVVAGLAGFRWISFGGRNAFLYVAASAFGYLLVGLLEESLLRGYLQIALARAIGFWWAALVLSVAFGLLHGGNAGETSLGLLGAGAGGLLFCLSLWYTKSLFWAVGFHSGFGWGESYFYGTANSGHVITSHLLATHLTGDTLWSGGSAGPEGSLLLLLLLVILLIGMCVWWGRGKPALGLREQWPF